MPEEESSLTFDDLRDVEPSLLDDAVDRAFMRGMSGAPCVINIKVYGSPENSIVAPSGNTLEATDYMRPTGEALHNILHNPALK